MRNRVSESITDIVPVFVQETSVQSYFLIVHVLKVEANTSIYSNHTWVISNIVGNTNEKILIYLCIGVETVVNERICRSFGRLEIEHVSLELDNDFFICEIDEIYFKMITLADM